MANGVPLATADPIGPKPPTRAPRLTGAAAPEILEVMPVSQITVRGARQHNLKNITVTIPRNSFTVITGLSGSGKSSLAFDTIYAEGQRRYVETLSAYARQFLDQMERPDVDSIEGLSPAISIEQRTTTRSPRSTVGTVTEIYDYLRLLYASIGTPHCPQCGKPIARQSPEQIVALILEQGWEQGVGLRVTIYAPIVRGRKGEFRNELEKLDQQGFRARVDGSVRDLAEPITLDKRKNHTIEAIVDRLIMKPGVEKRLESAVTRALQMAGGLVLVAITNASTGASREHLHSSLLACMDCGTSVPKLEPRSFSFNSTFGACPNCNGLGGLYDFDPAKVIVDWTKPLLDGGLGPSSGSEYMQRMLRKLAEQEKIDLRKPFEKLSERQQQILLNGPESGGLRRGHFAGVLGWLRDVLEETTSDSYKQRLLEYMSASECPACHGQRLRPESLSVRVGGHSIAEFVALPLTQALTAARALTLSGRERKIASRLQSEIVERLEFLNAVGLGYLTLSRSSATLSGGEAQRIRLATQIGTRLRGVLYVLDEPSIGLHQRDNDRLIAALLSLRDLGNTVLVVEHDEDTIRRADYVLDLGPGAGRLGGALIASGTPEAVEKTPGSLTGQYLAGKLQTVPNSTPRQPGQHWITVHGARGHNLRNVTARFPLGVITAVTGVSGSGKSTLVNNTLYRALAQSLYRSREAPLAHTRVEGLSQIDKAVQIDQSPIGRTPRSNPATYTGVFTAIRDLFSMLPESRERGYKAGRFSFNLAGGRCEACQGDGQRKIEMNFLPDVYVQCEVCKGRRYNQETLSVRFQGYSIADILDLPIADALPVLGNIPAIRQKLETLNEVGLGYVHLGQSATTLSGGEAQRMKLAKELSKRQTGRTLYLLDEPTTGLHFDDVRKLLEVLHRLASHGNTVIVIEHNLDVIRSADWILDLGPESGDEGGKIVAEGTPQTVAAQAASHTGRLLARYFAGQAPATPQRSRRKETA